MGIFTQEERKALRALFKLEEHEIREGGASKDKSKIQWFVYLRREAIQDRLDDLFFGEWELYFVDPAQPCVYHKEHVDSTMGLAIRGMRREYNGSQEGGGVNGAKGAATDAIKRVASLWGIGLYMQNAPQIWTENYASYDASGKKISTDWKKKDKIQADVMRQIGEWLKSLGAQGQSLYVEPNNEETETTAPMPQNVSKLPPVDADTEPWTKEQAELFSKGWQKDGYKPSEILEVLGVKRLGEWTKSLHAANEVMNKAMAQGF